jgi:hypothetical protein
MGAGLFDPTQRRFDERQETIVQITRRIDAWRLARASKPGGPLAGKRPNDWYKLDYIGPAKLTADAGRENKEDREDVKAGLLSPQEYYARFQQDYRSEYKKIKEAAKLRFEIAREIAAENGIGVLEAMAQVFDRTNGNPPQPVKPQGQQP